MNIVTIDSRSELAKHERPIEALAQECFEGRLNWDVWRWAYLANPSGEPLVALCYDEGRLVGHYALISMPLRSGTRRHRAYLNMTNMIAASHRKHGLFAQLAHRAYEHAKSSNVAFVMGFPNEQAAPGLRKRANWTLPAADVIATVSKADLLTAGQHPDFRPDERFALDLTDENFLQWRLAKPGARYTWRDGLLYKEFGDALDLMHFEDAAQLPLLPNDKAVNVLMPATTVPQGVKASFPYQFGGVAISLDFNPSAIRREMVMSDVF